MKANFFLFFVSGILTLPFCSCRKTESESLAKTDKFFSISTSLPNVVLRGISELKRQNAITGFIEDFTKKEGFAYWDKSLIKNSRNKLSFANLDGQDGGDTLVFIPLVRENDNVVNGFLLFKINVSIEVHLFRANDYDKFSYGGLNAESLNAEDVALMLMKLDKLIFGDRKFDLTDKDLFQSYINQPDSLKALPKKTIEYHKLPNNVDWLEICYITDYHCPGNCTGPNGTCDLCSPTCVTIECLSIPIEGEGGESGNWPPDPNPTNGGGGGGGGGPTGPGGGNCTPDGNCVIGTQIIQGRLPCGDCGIGPIIILPYNSPNQDPDQQWLNNNIIDNTNNNCVATTLTALRSISSKIPEIMRTIFGTTEAMDFDMTLTMEILPPTEGGNTTINHNDNHFQVQVNSYFTDATDLAVAATLIHEALHCQLMNWYRQASDENNTTRRDWLATNYGYIFSKESEDWDNNLASIVYGANGASQHQDIATRYRNTIANTLYQFAIAKGLNNVTMEYCMKLALSGCPDSKYFMDLSQTEKDQINEVVFAEKDPFSTSINVNSISHKGNPCL